MQIIGIFLKNGDPRVIKNLKENTWYPLGKFQNVNESFKDNLNEKKQEYQNLVSDINTNQYFINKLYGLKQSKKISINLNCILGKNGAGKSSLLNLEYRIINNLSCKINNCLPDYNQDYHQKWATGFNADLYYEIKSKIYCISVFNNSNFLEENFDYLENRVDLIYENNNSTRDLFIFLESQVKKIDVLTEEEKEVLKQKESELLNELSEHFFYSIATNYSIYSNAIVTNKWNNFYELWQEKLYHKNDGYLTPIVLVPYKYTGATIDTKKELSLADERVSTLSILIYAEKKLLEEEKKDFIENLTPFEIQYTLQSIEEYEQEIKKKYVKLFNPDADYESNVEDLYKTIMEIYKLQQLQPVLRSKIEDLLFSEDCKNQYIKNWNKDESVKKSELFSTVMENTIKYITFKIIKMCKYYDKYKALFHGKDLTDEYGNYTKETIDIYIKILEKVLTNTEETDFTDLKIKQCVSFLNNLAFYFPEDDLSIYLDNGKPNARTIDDFVTTFKNTNYSYDYIFKNLLPTYFLKDIKYIKTFDSNKTSIPTEDNEISISALSSGESHLINSISYAIYHMKNASSKNVNNEIDNLEKQTTRIQYKNMNLIFDEAELYYHPEYQKNFISNLLGILDRSNLNEIESINITIVTHSPFMLSDIPSSNILMLPQNKEINTISETLGANFYDLLKNQFFMESSIGAVVEKHLVSILNTFYETDINNELIENYNQNKKFLDLFFKNLGDSYLKSLVSDVLNKMNNKSKSIKDQISECKDKLKQLEKMQELEENEGNQL
jgi:hypothetical protein